MNPAIAVFIGGGLGSLSRYWISHLTSHFPLFNFPSGTLLSNVISSLILGIFLGYTDLKTDHENSLRFLIAIGFCGGFSTFSTFSAETFVMLKNGLFIHGLINIGTNLFACLIMIGVGIWMGKSI